MFNLNIHFNKISIKFQSNSMEHISKVLEEFEFDQSNEFNKLNEFEIIDTILKIKQENFEYYIEILPDGEIISVINNVLSDHVVRLLNIKKFNKVTSLNVFDIFSLFNNMNLILQCTICSKKINSYNKINCCDNTECRSKFVELVTDNSVTECYSYDKLVFNFLILTAYACLKHPKREYIFKPFPPNFNSLKELDQKLKYNSSNGKILFDVMKNITSDYELMEKIGIHDYSFLKFTINSNITNLRSDLLFQKNENIFDEKHLENIFDHDDVICFKVDQDPMTNKKIEGVEHNYLFHGGTLSNWYSILRNGVKVYSGTEMQLNGQAHGPGVYLSDTMTMSFTYGTDRYCASTLCVYGVFQILHDKKTYFKSTNIYVVPNENELVLRYLIVIKQDKNLKTDVLTKINNYFMVQKQKEVKSAFNKYNEIRAKRISYDIDKIKKICDKLKWKIDNNINDDFNKILIFDSDNEDNKICVSYSEDYPSTPPHIWIIKTNKQINNMDILSCGGIMNRKLSYKFWQTGTEIHKIIKSLIQSIISSPIVIPAITYSEETSFTECTNVSKLMV